MLINDSTTIACEVPVWFWEKNLNAGIFGHIDVLQVRFGLIYVMDYKPGAIHENVQKVASQLLFYSSGLSFRTKYRWISSDVPGSTMKSITSLIPERQM